MMEECGLLIVPSSDGGQWKYGQVPLKSVSVQASVVHAVGQVEITQVYKNEEKDPIEPVDSNGAVVHFQAEMEDGRVIKGVIDTVEKAKERYEKAIKSHTTAFLGEEIKPDIKPGSIAKVTIGYVTEVKNDADSHGIRFFIPTTVAPRYVASENLNSGDIVTRNRAKNIATMEFRPTSPAPLAITLSVCVKCLPRSGMSFKPRHQRHVRGTHREPPDLDQVHHHPGGTRD